VLVTGNGRRIDAECESFALYLAERDAEFLGETGVGYSAEQFKLGSGPVSLRARDATLASRPADRFVSDAEPFGDFDVADFAERLFGPVDGHSAGLITGCSGVNLCVG
jgi:hypothetical protein